MEFQKIHFRLERILLGFVIYITKIMPSEIFFSQATRIVFALLVNPTRVNVSEVFRRCRNGTLI